MTDTGKGYRTNQSAQNRDRGRPVTSQPVHRDGSDFQLASSRQSLSDSGVLRTYNHDGRDSYEQPFYNFDHYDSDHLSGTGWRDATRRSPQEERKTCCGRCRRCLKCTCRCCDSCDRCMERCQLLCDCCELLHYLCSCLGAD